MADASDATPRPPGGLTALELGHVVGELAEELRDAAVTDVARLRDRDDLLLYFETEQGRRALHLAPGGRRARVCTTRRRFDRARFATGPQVDALNRALRGARLRGATHPAGERTCAFELWHGARNQAATVVVELFGPRGLWCLLDGEGVVREVSRPAHARGRQLAPGDRYAPPPAKGSPPPQPARFAAPWSAAIDAHYTAEDQREESAALTGDVARALRRVTDGQRHRVEGLREQQRQIRSAHEIRQTADLLLAYGGSVARGAAELVVPDPADPDRELRLPLDPARPAHAQAEALYRRARKLEDAAAVVGRRLADAEARLAQLEAWSAELAAAGDGADPVAWRRRLLDAGAWPKTPAPPAAPPRIAKITQGENFRRFESAEGHLILVGRSNAQNDRLTVRVARGNDLWMHVGMGHAGSHVVVRLPRGKTASLETLLDAGTLAVHFSKARGNPRCEVIYTQAKHVRKPKGLPPGRVVPSHTKTLVVRHEPERLRRLLGD